MDSKKGMEPDACWLTSEKEALHSIAISLKRIADALTGPEGHRAAIFDQPVNNYGETIGEAIQGQIVRGMRGIDCL